MDKGTIRFIIIAIIVVVGINMILETILEIRKADLELLSLNKGRHGQPNGHIHLPKSRGNYGKRLLVDSKIRSIERRGDSDLNLAEITRLVCNDKKAERALGSDSDKSILTAYTDLRDHRDRDNDIYNEGVHSDNFYDNRNHPYEAPLGSKLRDINELNVQNDLIVEQFHGIHRKQHPGDRSWGGGGDLRHYFPPDHFASQFKDPDIRVPAMDNPEPDMKPIYNSSSEMAPWQESIRGVDRVYKVDNWIYENENIMNGGKFGVLTPFDTFGSDTACV